MEKSYWAFISYSSRDARQGEWLHRRLENYPIPAEFRGTELFDGGVLGKNLRPIFRDRDELAGSADLGSAIASALRASRFLIVLCSPRSASSEWVNKEIEEFKSLGKERNILALIIDGEPNATTKGRPEEECFPPALRAPLAEPIAGDMRREGDGRERGFLKILAGVTQVDFDKLYRRHERNQARRRAIIGAVAVLLIVLFGGLATVAWRQSVVAGQKTREAEAAKHEADTQRDAAVAARGEAEHQRAVAVHQESVAKQKYRDVLFSKYEAAKAAGAQEEALAYLAEVLTLTRADGASDSQLSSLLDFEQTQAMSRAWSIGDPLPVVDSAFVTRDGGVALWQKDGGFWYARENHDATGAMSFERVHPELGAVNQAIQDERGDFFLVAGGGLVELSPAFAPRRLLDMSSSDFVPWLEYDIVRREIILVKGREIVSYGVSDLEAGAAPSPRRAKLDLDASAIVYDFALDPASGRLALRTNIAGKRLVSIVEAESGRLVASVDRQGSVQAVRLLGGRFTLCASNEGQTPEILLIDPRYPSRARRVAVPWSNPRICENPSGGLFLVTDQATLRTLSVDGMVSPPLDAGMERYWGDEDIHVTRLGPRIVVSSARSLQILERDRRKFVTLRSRYVESADSFTPLADGIILSAGLRGWQLRKAVDGGVLRRGGERGGTLATDGARSFLVWEGRRASVIGLDGSRHDFDLPDVVPRAYFEDRALLAAEKGGELELFSIGSSGLGEALSVGAPAPDLLNEVNGSLVGTSKSKDGKALEIWSFDLAARQLVHSDRYAFSMKDNGVLSTAGGSLYWRDAEGYVVRLDLASQTEKTAIGPAGSVRFAVDKSSATLVPVSRDEFAMAEDSGKVDLYDGGRKVRSFLPATDLPAAKIAFLGGHDYLVLAGGTLTRVALPMSRIAGGLGDDSGRLLGPRFQAFRDGPAIEVRWADGRSSQLVGLGNGVSGYSFIAQNRSQTWIAAIDKDQIQVLAWPLVAYSERPVPLTFTYDDLYGGLWFADESTLVAGVPDKALVLRLARDAISVRATIPLAGMGKANLFDASAGRWYFGRRGQRRLLSVAPSGGVPTILYASSEPYGLCAKADGLFIGLLGAIDLVDPVSGSLRRRYSVPDTISPAWQVWKIVVDERRGWLLCDQGPRLSVFDRRSGLWIGSLEMPETLDTMLFGAGDPDRLHLGGEHFSRKLDFKAHVADLDAFYASLPFRIVDTEAVVRFNPVRLDKGNGDVQQ